MLSFFSDRQIITCKEGVLCLTKDSLRLSKRRGITISNFKCHQSMKDLNCMLYKNRNNDYKNGLVYLAGNQEELIELDIENGKKSRLIDIYEDGNGVKNCHLMKGHPRFICMADCDGKVVCSFLKDSC